MRNLLAAETPIKDTIDKLTATVTYATFDGVLVYENRGGVETEYTSDTLGNLIECHGPDGVSTYTADYWPYGGVRTSTGTNPSPWGFVGLLGYYTDALNFLYVRARYYRPNLTRWQTVDPLWSWQSVYGYCLFNPVSNADPSGLLVIPNPPPGITQAAWDALIALLEALGASLIAVIAILLAIIALIALIGLACDGWIKHRYKVCPSQGTPSSGLQKCKPGDGCMATVYRAEMWADCAAIQAFLTVICFNNNPSHNDILKRYIEQYLKCESLILHNCTPKWCRFL